MDSTEARRLGPGERFRDRYEVVRVIGTGGMGVVYEVLDHVTERRRALKIMQPAMLGDEESRRRFRREATVAAAIDSDHVAEVVDAGVDEERGAPFIVMELLRGQELAELLSDKGALSAEDTVLYLSQAALALDKAHAAGIVHRDLKPENLFVTVRDDGSPRVKLLDFGIAKMVDRSTGPQTKGILGTPLYMAPEQVHGEVPVSGRTDVYALGHIAYALLTGEPYYTAEQDRGEGVYQLLIVLLRGAAEPASKRAASRKHIAIPATFDAWFARATALLPQDRFATPGEATAALADALGVERSARANSGSLPRQGGGGAAKAPGSVAVTPPGLAPLDAAGQAVATSALPPMASPGPLAGASGPARTVMGAPRAEPSAPVAPARTLPGVPNDTPAAPLVPTAPAATPQKRSSPLLTILIVGVIAGGGAVAFLATRGSSADGGDGSATSGSATGSRAGTNTNTSASGSANTNTNTNTNASASGSTNTNTVSGPSASTSAGSTPGPEWELTGGWLSPSGKHFDAVWNGSSFEMRVRDPSELRDAQSPNPAPYQAREARFILSPLPASPGQFSVLDRSRPIPPPNAHFDLAAVPGDCLYEWTDINQQPLRAQLSGNKLGVALASPTFPNELFKLDKGVVVGCPSVARVKLVVTRSELERER